MSLQAWIPVAVALAVFAAMASDRIAPHRAALAGAAVLILGGQLDARSLSTVLGSAGLVIITCMMLVAAALEHTGQIDRFVRALLRQVGRRPRQAWLRLYAAVLLGSGVVANTPVVVLAAPAVTTLARQSLAPLKRMLLPIVFLSSLGGCLSLVGSSVNLIASQSLVQAGLPALGLFEFSLLGLACAAAGAAFLALFGPRLLPRAPPPSPRLYEPDRPMVGLLAMGAGDAAIGASLGELQARHPGITVLDCLRADGAGHGQADARTTADGLLQALVLRPGDRLRVEAPASWWVEQDLQARAPGDAREVVEVWLPPQSRWLGLSAQQLRLEEIFGVRLLAQACTHGRPGGARRLQVGDRLLLSGPRRELERLLAAEHALGPLQVERAGYAVGRRWVAWLALAAIGLSAVGWLSLQQAAVLAALVVVLGGAVSPTSPLNRPSVRTLGLVFGMLAIGEALVGSGAVAQLADALEHSAASLPPWVLLGVVILFATLATEVLTNGAAVALLAPVVVSLCISLGLDPRPFVIAVLFGASASFASPLAYQTNTFVHQIGGYRWVDFLRLGVPLKLLVCGLSWLLIPQLWSLQAAP